MRIKKAKPEEDYKKAIDKGLEGVVACSTKISTIRDGNLFYRNYSIQDLAKNSNFEEVIFLLWNARLPHRTELEEFKKKLNSYIKLEDELIEILKKFPVKNIHPMAWLRTAVSFLSLYERSNEQFSVGDKALKKEDLELNTAFSLTARMGQLVALFERTRKGQEFIPPLQNKSLAWNFYYCLKGIEPDQEIVDILDTCLILHADHELNCSTFSARVTSSSLSDIYSAIVSGIGTLKGPLHGGANEQVMRSLKEIQNLENVKPWLKEALGLKKKIMGFGHRVYKKGDPRAKVLEVLSQSTSKKMGQEKWYKISKKLEEEMKQAKGLLPNVDFYSATVYHSLDFSYDLFTPIFTVARIGGWLAHIFEQREKNRIYRPRAKWTGKEMLLKWIPLGQRNSNDSTMNLIQSAN